MARLTKMAKGDILNSVINRTLGDRERALKHSKAQLADLLYNAVYSAEDRAKMAALPENWLYSSIYIYAKNSALKESCPGDTWHEAFEFTSCRRFPYKEASVRHPVEDFDEKMLPTIRDAYKIIEAEEKAIEESKKTLRKKVGLILDSVTTEKRLLEVWPEAAQYLPDYTPATDNLPAVTAKELNELIAVLKPVSGDPPAGSEDEVMHIQV